MKKNIFDKEVNNKLKKKAINERGSVTIFVLATVLFILMVLISVYANKSSKVNSQIVKINNLKEQYEQGPSIDEVYEETNKGDNPVVSFSNNGGGYLIVVGKTNVEVETKISVKDLNGKGIKSVKYQLSMSENFPSESDSNWQSISEEYTMERVLTGGKWYLHVLAIDNVGLKTEQTSQAFTVCYQVKFNGNGGENTPSEQKKEHDKALKLTELKPTATGKTFIGWSRVNNAMEAEYLPGEEYTENAAIELFAVWAENTYTVAYNGNGATSGSMANSSHKYGVSAALNKNTYKKTGYTFVNWNTKADGTGKSYGDGESVINLTENAGEVVTLYAQWRINSYTATFNPNGGGTPKPSKITKNYGEKLGTLPTVEREGWNFEGWYTEAEGGTKIKENTTMLSGNVTYYAHWTDIEGPQITSLTANPTTWTNEKVTLTGKAIDKGSGIVEFQFSTNSNLTGDSSGWTQIENTKEEITKTYSVSSNGTYYFYVKDAVGNIAKKEIKVSNIDVTAPTKPVITNSSNGNLTNQNVVVTIKSTDTQSGIARYEWYENGGWTTRAITIKDGVGTITYTADRNNMTIRFRAVDNAGNISEESTTVVNLDKTGPVISSITNSSNGQWTKDPVKLTWTITENGSGIEKVEYGYDGKTWQGNLGTAEWNGLTRSNERNDVLYIRATDKAGNVSNIQSSAMKIDTTLPTVGIGTNGGTYKITAGNTTVNISTTLTAGDEGGSGLKNIQYQISNSSTIPADNDANWKNFTSGASITEAKTGGTWYLYTKVTDNAGNRATTIQKSNAYVVNYQILYNANGGNGEPGEQTKTHGQDLTLSATKPTREGYTFLGWSEDSKATSATYSSGGLYKNNKAVTLYAVWSKGEYSLTVNPNGGTWEGSTGSQQFTQTYGSTKTISNPTAPAGYKVTYNGNGGSTPSAQTSTKSFTGWTTSGAGTLSGTTYTFGAGAGTLTANYKNNAITLQTPTRTGYTFAGWYDAATGGNKIGNGGASYTPTKAITLYAHWTVNSYTLTVNPNGGTWEGSTGSQQFTQTYGSTKTISNPTAPAGYKVTYNGNGGSTPSAQTSTKSFTGWTTSGAGTLSGTTYTFGAGAGTLTANYKNNAITLQTPTRTGYTFAGWYDAATGGNKVGNGGASYTPTKAITLYAHWTANTYTVAFNGNGNTGGSTASVSMTYDTAKNLTANGYTKTGYTFKSWNTKPDGSGTTYANSASVKNLTSTNGGTVTLYAQWTANTYTIAFNGNGNTGGSTASVSMTYDTAKNLTANGFTKTGYTFKSWNTKSDGTGTTYANSASVKNLTSTNGGTVTLYAQWTKKQVVVTFMRNTSSTDTTSATQTFTYGTAGQSFSNKNWTRTGYSLLGWSEDKNATTQQYSTLSGVSDSWIDSKSPKVTLYAVWKANSYTATFNSNGGGTPSPSTITKTYGTQLGTLPTVSRTGYTFKGWFTQSTGGEKISTTTTMPANNVTYYAQWTANTYTIEYNANGGTGSTVSSSHTYGVSKALTKNGFTKTGYTFLGWSKDKTATSATYTDEQSVVNISSTNGEKVILYAIWEINSYTVTYNYSANGGTSATKTTATFNYGEAVDLTPVATKSEYTFVGWNTEQTATSKLNSLNMGTNNITLYAIYSKTITATFKYYNNQSESINKTIYNRETTATLTTKGAIGTPSRTYF